MFSIIFREINQLNISVILVVSAHSSTFSSATYWTVCLLFTEIFKIFYIYCLCTFVVDAKCWRQVRSWTDMDGWKEKGRFRCIQYNRVTDNYLKKNYHFINWITFFSKLATNQHFFFFLNLILLEMRSM